jgi:hypothetical protein
MTVKVKVPKDYLVCKAHMDNRLHPEKVLAKDTHLTDLDCFNLIRKARISGLIDKAGYVTEKGKLLMGRVQDRMDSYSESEAQAETEAKVESMRGDPEQQHQGSFESGEVCMIEFKYVMFELDFLGEAKKVPILFPPDLVHKDVAEALLRDCVNLRDAKPVSAGTVKFRVDRTFGYSDTLDLTASEDDLRVLNTYNYFHGLL